MLVLTKFTVLTLLVHHCYSGFRESTQPSGDTKTFLLIQNWWQNKRFIEVDDEYFANSPGVMVHFIRHPQLGIPSSFGQLDGNYFEAAEGAEACEGMPEEG